MTVGSIVLFKGRGGAIRPAIVTRVWTETTVNLTVFLEGASDMATQEFAADECLRGLAQRTSVQHGDDDYQWQWPELHIPAAV